MAYDTNKLTKLSALKSLAEKIKTDYETKVELNAVNTNLDKSFKSGKVEGNKVSLYTSADKSGTAAFTFDFPTEFFLDQTKTTFVASFSFSTSAYPGATNPNLNGKPVMVLAVKGDDNSVTYSFIDVSKLVDTYTAKAGDGSATVTVSGNQISVDVNVFEDISNALVKRDDGTLYVPKSAVVDITGKADKVSNAVNGNLAGLDSTGNLTNSGIAASNVITGSVATDTEVSEMINEVFA